jgi:hypothetical protein
MRVALATSLLRGDRVGDTVLKGPRQVRKPGILKKWDLNGSAGG